MFPFTGRFGQRLRQTDVTYRVKQLAKEAGVRLTMHQLRKGFGCRVARQLGKGGAAMLHELMRHSSMQVSEVTEPYLVRAGLVEKDDLSRRQLTTAGRVHCSSVGV